jgi:hypothetical protein
MSLGGLKFQLGPTGFLSWLIPTILAVCGLLLWFTPQQRVFYGVVASITAVYSLIGVNLGGFFVGMLLGVIGGGLGFAWVPRRPKPDAPPGDPAGPDEDATTSPSTADGQTEPYGEEFAHSGGGPDEPPAATVDELLTGPLTDVLPAPVNPLAPQREPLPERTTATERGTAPERAQPNWGPIAERADETTQPLPLHRPAAPSATPAAEPSAGEANHRPDSGGALPRRGPHLFVITLVPLTLAAVLLTTVHGGLPAFAAPCSTPSKSTGASKTPGPGTSATPTPGAPASSTPTPSPQASSSSGGNPISDVLNGIGNAIGGLLGIGGSKSTASPTPSPTPSTAGGKAAVAAPAVPGSGTSKATTPTPTKSGTCSGASPSTGAGKAKSLAAAADQPLVGETPSQMTGSKLTLSGFSFDGVVSLPTHSGTIRALQFSMDTAVTDNFELRPLLANGNLHSLKSTQLTVDNLHGTSKVKFYTSRFQGKLVEALHIPIPIGVPLTFTPDSPPPLTVSEMVFADINIQLVFVDSVQLIAKNLVDTRIS